MLLGMLQLGRHRCGQRACREECEPHLTSLSVDDVQTGRGSRILAHGFAIIPEQTRFCPLMAIKQLAPNGG